MHTPRRANALIEISPEGRIAAVTTAAVFIVTAIAVLMAWWQPLWRRCNEIEGPCIRGAAAAGLFAMGSIAMLAAGVAMIIRARRRPVEPSASSRYVWWLGALFAVAVVVASWKVPSFTCERGRFDALLERCMHPPTTSAPARWVALKNALLGVGFGGGAAISFVPRWVRVTAPVATVTWFAVLGWIVADELGRRGGSP